MTTSSLQCRVCLKAQGNEVFQQLIGGNNELAQMLYYVAEIMIVDLKDYHPSFICKNCLKDLTKAVKFKEKALKSEKIFKKRTKDRELKLWNIEVKQEEPEAPVFSQAVIIKTEAIEFEGNEVEDDFMKSFDNPLGDEFRTEPEDKEPAAKDEDFIETITISESKPQNKKRYGPYKHECWCGVQFPAANKLRIHQIMKHEEVRPDQRPCCDYCGKCFKVKSYLLTHMKYNHINRKKIEELRQSKPQIKKRYGPYTRSDKHKCWCGVQLPAANRLRVHQIMKHEEVRPDQRPCCDLCGKSFKIKSYLLTHMKYNHINRKKIEENRQPCSICGKLLVKGALKFHEERHEISNDPEKQTRFRCDICGRGYSMKLCVKQHIERFHLKLKKFKCKLCSFRSIYGIALHYHKRKHMQAKPFKCSFCGKNFEKKYNCTVHERIHTNVRPYSCRFCDKTFIHHSDYRRHELRHTGGISKKEFNALLAKGVNVPIKNVV